MSEQVEPSTYRHLTNRNLVADRAIALLKSMADPLVHSEVILDDTEFNTADYETGELTPFNLRTTELTASAWLSIKTATKALKELQDLMEGWTDTEGNNLVIEGLTDEHGNRLAS
jgi:hypothetical protein